MWESVDVKKYIESLPKDFKIKHGLRQFHVNKDLFMSISKFSAEQYDSTLEIDVEDPGDLMPLVAKYITGGNIDVDATNDVELKKLAEYLGISSLAALCDKSMAEPLSLSNIFPRIQRENANIEEFQDFLVDHAAEIIRDKRVYSLPIRTLQFFLKSDNFLNEMEKWRFAFECWKRYPENVKELNGTAEEIVTMPEEAISELVTRYSNIDGLIPASLLIENLRKSAAEREAQLAALERRLLALSSSVREAKQKHMEELERQENETIASHEKAKLRLIELACDCELTVPDVGCYLVNSSVKSEIEALLDSIVGECAQLLVILPKVWSRPSVRDGGKALVEESCLLVDRIKQSIDQVVTNGEDVKEMMEELRSYAHELQRMTLETLSK